nr:MAG TPA: hypothetical protein [Caudoviricetes sp.]
MKSQTQNREPAKQGFRWVQGVKLPPVKADFIRLRS